MPGKVNPVIPELVNVVAFRVMGNDYGVTLAAHSGQLQLKRIRAPRGPQYPRVPASALHDFANFSHQVHRRHHRQRKGARALHGDDGRHRDRPEPRGRIREATELANEAYKSGKGILEIIREKKILSEKQIADLLDPIKLTNLNKAQYKK
jgi:aspartate ammonia-lyase